MSVQQELQSITCYKCGVMFAIPAYLDKKHREDGESFWCPNGHGQVYSKPEVEVLNQQLQQEKSSHSLTKQILSDSQLALKKVENRIANGACPCCRRNFSNLQRHMHSKHPDYVAVVRS